MKENIRKFVAIVISLTILICCFPTISAYAMSESDFNSKLSQLRDKYPNYSTWTSSFDGGTQCYGFARLIAYEVFGSKPSTWQRVNSINNVKAGDVLQYGPTTGSGHTVFVTKVSGNTITFVDCNGNGNYNGSRKVRTCGIKWDNTISKYGEMYDRIPFAYLLSSPEIIDPYDNPVDLGTNFYAYIINTSAWKHLTNDGCNVSMRSETGAANQVWKFERYEDGGYKIINCKDNNVLDVYNFGTKDGTNVQVWTSNDSSAQRWYIYGSSGSYFLKAKCGDLVLDINGGLKDDGTNVQMWTKNDSAAQKFQIWKLNKPTQTYVNCAAGTNYTPTSIWWDKTEYTSCYDVKIWKGKYWEGDPYKVLWGVKDSSCLVDLPEGYYEAYVDSRNNYSTSMSRNVIKFTVTHGTQVNCGDDFYAAIIINKNWLTLTNTNGNVDIRKEATGNNQIWHFRRQSDGTYTIQNLADGKYLDVDSSIDKNGTNIKVWTYNGSDAQRFFIYGRWSGEYYIKPKCATRVLDICGGKNNSGDNVQLWDLNYTDAQKFAIWQMKQPGKANVNVSPGTSTTETKITWNATSDTTNYVVKIWKNKAWQGTAFKEVDTKDTKLSVILPEGTYEVYVDSNNSYSYTCSNVVKFEVKKGICTHKFSSWKEEKAVGCTTEGTDVRKCSVCGITETRTVKAAGHKYTANVVKPTCTEKGYTIHRCSVCGSSYKDTYTNETGHRFSSWTVTKAAGCKAEGTKQRKCSVCGKVETQKVPASGHKYSKDWTVDQAATCTLTGSKSHHCTVCGEKTDITKIAAKGHSFGSWANTKPSSCVKNGEQSRKCSACGKTETQTVKAAGHKYTATVVKPTCTEKGYTIHRCSVCGNSYKDTYTNETGHKFSSWTVTKAAGCKTEGTKQRKCSVCGKVESQKIPASGHKYSKDWTIDQAATCTLTGSKSHHCTVCGEKTDITKIAAKGHSFGSWANTKPSSCVKNGEQSRKCSACGKTETQTVKAAGHKYTANVVKPTCTEKGYTIHRCSVCGNSYKDTYTNETGHKFSSWTVTKAAGCKAEGTKQRKCSVCGKVEVQKIPASGHKYSKDWTVDQAATCTLTGSKSHHCTVCGEKTNITKIAAKGHSFGSWTNTKTASCVKDGEQSRKCTACGKTETQTVKAAGHKYTATVVKPTCTEKGYTFHKCTVCGNSYKDTYTNETGHKFSSWTVTKAAGCKTEGTKQRKCSVCGKVESQKIPASGHAYKAVKTVAATAKDKGYVLYQCSECRATQKNSFTSYIGKAKISGISNKDYTGKKITQILKVTYGKAVLKNGRDYTVLYKNNVKVGKATVIVSGKGKYSGSVSKSFNIVPRKTSLTLKSPSRGKISVVLSKRSEATKYQIQYATNSKFKGAKIYTTKSMKADLKELPSKTYYIRVRAIKEVKEKGKTVSYIGKWSSAKKIKVK